MKEHNVIEVISYKDASKVASKDAPSQSTKSTYVEKNTLSYYILINTWVLLWKNFARHAWHRLLSQIVEQGLIPVINTCQEEAMRIIRDEDLGPVAQILYSELKFGEPVIEPGLANDVIGIDEDATVLMLLRYPKRFSPSDNDIIQDKTLADFIAYENRTKLLQRYSSYGRNEAVKWVRECIHEMYPWDEIIRDIDNLSPQDLLFSGGASLDARPNLGSKYMAIVRDGNHSDFILPIFGQYTLNRYAAHKEASTMSKVVAVPKSYKSSRIIAMERTYPIALGKSIEMIFRRYDQRYHTGINLDDQSINQYYAQLGSIEGTIATLDASHASDLISKSLFHDVFPLEYTRRVGKLLPQYVDIGKGRKPQLQMASTSGHTLTFRHETIVYKAIAMAAINMAESLGIPIEHECAIAYGDDTLVSTEAYDIALYLFARLGLVINEDKSYATGKYRESCGKDYIDGVDVTSIYYPRFPVLGTITDKGITLDKRTYRDEYRGKLDNSVSMLIDLQKKLYPYTYDGARFVASVVQTAYPSVTASLAGTVCNDLWDVIDSGKVYEPTAWKLELYGDRFPRSRKFVPLGRAADQLSGNNQQVFGRYAKLDTVHCYPTEAYERNMDFDEESIAVYEYWKYTRFLRYGPEYSDPLDELLGISSKPMSISEFFGKKTLALRKHR